MFEQPRAVKARAARAAAAPARAADAYTVGEQVMTVCNACRYCEQYCPVFPAMEDRVRFGKADLDYLANLCHNCGECLYACQYAPPHQFGINVPLTLSRVRLQSYEDYCWPRAVGVAFRKQGLLTTAALVAGLAAIMLLVPNPDPVAPLAAGSFYAVLPYDVMVTLFGGVSVFVVAALSIGVRRFQRQIQGATGSSGASLALRDVLTLRHLHGSGVDCASGEEQRSPWRRWFHHCTFYGFLLCFASTTVAALYHHILHATAPYASTSLPVMLGTVGGIGLVIGPAGLLALRRRRDPALGVKVQDGLDEPFIALLMLTSITGLALLVLRDRQAMPTLLVVHLAAVLALFLTLPYGKFVHGLYRTVALLKYSAESRR
jgi:citrate/tricarballylate utilization protein